MEKKSIKKIRERETILINYLIFFYFCLYISLLNFFISSFWLISKHKEHSTPLEVYL